MSSLAPAPPAVPLLPLLAPTAPAPAVRTSSWTPTHLDDPPAPPPPDTREEQLAALAAQEKLGHDGKRQRVRARRTVDPFGGLERFKIFKSVRSGRRDELFIRNQPGYLIDVRSLPCPRLARALLTFASSCHVQLLPAHAYQNFSTSFCSRYAHTSTNKIRCPVNIVTVRPPRPSDRPRELEETDPALRLQFTPDARRILTGSTSGEFTLWNGLTFNFETILQAHDSAVRALSWSNSGQWLLSADNSGLIKYFQPNMNNLQIFQGHGEAIRDVSWAPNDERFATGADDGVIKIWNFERMKEEKVLTGHGWDVKCVKWHPTKGLLASGSKDNLVKFWDPRTSTVLTTLYVYLVLYFPLPSLIPAASSNRTRSRPLLSHGHKNTIQALSWSPNGHMVATASRDQLVKVFDIRAMKELVTLRGHKKEVCSVAWHPIHSDVLVSGGSEGSILHWSLPDPAPKETLEFAHDSNVWSLAYHPLGHLLVSASNDHTTRFWSRGRPGVRVKGDRFHVGRERARELGEEGENPAHDDGASSPVFSPSRSLSPSRDARTHARALSRPRRSARSGRLFPPRPATPARAHRPRRQPPELLRLAPGVERAPTRPPRVRQRPARGGRHGGNGDGQRASTDAPAAAADAGLWWTGRRRRTRRRRGRGSLHPGLWSTTPSRHGRRRSSARDGHGRRREGTAPAELRRRRRRRRRGGEERGPAPESAGRARAVWRRAGNP
ncbi:SPOSA6832_01332, partial [Sporobolomyces salmonicolor]